MNLNLEENTRFIKMQASNLGFFHCGISKAEFLHEQAPRLEAWLKKNYHGEMIYMDNHFDKRLDPRLLVDDAKSVISLMLNYYPGEEQKSGVPKISRYAWGDDYHDVIKKKCFELLEKMRERFGDFNGRCFVDSAPVMDKVWAEKSGLGWIGKNSNLIHKGAGSYFFLAELIVDIPFLYDNGVADFCGSCTRCLDACPTNAIVEPFVVDGSRCISYLTIELKNEIPLSFKGKTEDWIFGCDICQEVCPWNRFSKKTDVKEFQSQSEWLNNSSEEWMELTEEAFRKVFRGSAIKRTKYSGFMRNLKFIRKQANE